MQTTINHPVTEDNDELPFSAEFVAMLVSEGRTKAMFQFALEFLNSDEAFAGSDWAPEEQEERRENVIARVKHQLGEAIQAQHSHCGQPLAVRGTYDLETQRHGLLIRCNCCGTATIIEEKSEHIH